MNPYETDKLVHEYLLFHYATPEEILPHENGPVEALDFAVRTPSHTGRGSRALDLGCAVGRSSFELSKTCDQVIGIDFSQAFINAAETIRTGIPLQYERLEEASTYTTLTASLPPGVHPENIRFEVGDAMNLRADLGRFDIVHAANLICRLPEPEKLLNRLPDLITPSGTLVLATPCTWLEEYTAKEHFPNAPTLEWLKEKLSPHFTLVEQHDEPFLIRETARKFQWTVSLLTKWERV